MHHHAFTVGSDVNMRIKGVMQAHATSDRDMMLRQIEALKVARQEAEAAKLDVGRLSDELTATVRELADVRRHHNDALARLKDLSEAMLYVVPGRGPGNTSEGVIAQVGRGYRDGVQATPVRVSLLRWEGGCVLRAPFKDWSLSLARGF